MLRVTVAAMSLISLTACLPTEPKAPPSGADDFISFCSACHGAGGKGDGEVAATLATRPADLTRLSARNDGAFPMTRVMAKIWGYTGGQSDAAVMPQFAALLDSDLVPYDSGDGILTPTPLRLVQIAEHIRALQE
jgi:cytochrome c553